MFLNAKTPVRKEGSDPLNTRLGATSCFPADFQKIKRRMI